jgi:hypothetical protein
MRRHHSGDELGRCDIALKAAWQRDIRIGDGVLVVDGDHRQTLAVANMAG